MSKKINKIIGRNIRYLRLSDGFSQTYCSKACGIEQATWSQYEAGRIELPISRAIQIAEFFGTNVNGLIKGVL